MLKNKLFLLKHYTDEISINTKTHFGRKAFGIILHRK